MAQPLNSSQSSPMKIKFSGYTFTYDLDKQRQNTVWDPDEQVPEVKRSFFEQYLLPPSRIPTDDSLEAIVERLKESGKINKKNMWWGWKKPSESGRLFKDFAPLVKDIVKAARLSEDDRNVDITCNPALSLKSYTRKNTSKPDCYGIWKGAELEGDPATKRLQPKWLDVATPGEFKKDNTQTDFVDDARKVLWSMHHIMREDPRRCFVIGFTIEDSSMRFWYCSRSGVFVSEAFDWLKEHAVFADFVLRISFATKVELGWDPSIELHRATLDNGPGELQYDITVQGEEDRTPRTFRTQRVLSNVGAEALRGRGTRVWEVRELNADKEVVGNPCVLKDSWVDTHRRREGDILKEIRETAAKRGDAIYHRIHDSLLTTVVYGDVRGNKRVDNTCHWTEAPQYTGMKIIRLGVKASRPIPPSVSTRGAHVTEAEEEKKPKSSVAWPSKVHHRIVFEEICDTIRDISSLAEAFCYLAHIADVLRCIHELGWVHRDISSGNILVFKGIAKLADLEYAQHESDLVVHEIRAGTPYFMSVEVENTEYLAASESVPKPAPAANGGEPLKFSEAIDALMSKRKGRSHNLPSQGLKSEATRPEVPFNYNPLHDMESLMWLGWFLLLPSTLASIGSTPLSTLDIYTRNQHKLANEIFTNEYSRMKIMTVDTALRKLVTRASLHKTVSAIAEELLGCHSELRGAYKSAEQDLTERIPFTVAKSHNLYTIYIEKFANIVGTLSQEDSNIIVTPDQSSCDRLRKELCPEQVLDHDAQPKPDEGSDNSDGDAAASSGRPLKKQKTVDDRNAATLASYNSRLEVGSRGNGASENLSNTKNSSPAPAEPGPAD